jgi:hypothetical protein
MKGVRGGLGKALAGDPDAAGTTLDADHRCNGPHLMTIPTSGSPVCVFFFLVAHKEAGSPVCIRCLESARLDIPPRCLQR